MNSEHSKPRLFVVDDEKVVADTISAVLRAEGFEVETFYDGLPALERAMEDPPEAVVTDIVMPGLDGLRLAALLKEHCPDCLVTLISGQPTAMYSVRSLGDEMPRVTLLEKPIHPADLVAEIRGALGLRD